MLRRSQIWRDLLVAEGLTRNISDETKKLLIDAGYTGQYNQALHVWLRSQGYSGQFSKRLRQWEEDGFPSLINNEVPEAPEAVSPPSISGSADVTSTLAASPGTWTGIPAPVVAEIWQRDGVDIAGETGLTYTTVDPTDIGTAITYKETATNSSGSVSVSSTAINVVDSADDPVIANAAYNGFDTLAIDVSKAATIYWLINNTEATVAATIKAGGGLDSGSFAVVSGANSDDITFDVAAGNHWLHIVADDGSDPLSNVVSTEYQFFAATANITLEQDVVAVEPDATSGPTLTAALTPAAVGNIVLAIYSLESNSSTLDTSIDAGGGSLPTLDGNTMTFVDLGRSSRRHVGIYIYHPNSTSSQTFSCTPANGVRSASVCLMEWSGVNTTTMTNASADAKNTSTGAGLTVDLTTVAGTGKLVAGFASNKTDSVMPISVGNVIDTEQTTGGGASDHSVAWAQIDVAVIGATEGMSVTQTTGNSMAGAIVELNPA